MFKCFKWSSFDIESVKIFTDEKTDTHLPDKSKRIRFISLFGKIVESPVKPKDCTL